MLSLTDVAAREKVPTGLDLYREQRTQEDRMSRTGRVQRTTSESDVLVELDLDGTGRT